MIAIFAQRPIPSSLLTARESLHKRWSWYVLLGLALVILGALAITVAVFTTFVSVIFFGCLLIASGIAMIYHATRFWKRNWRDFSLYTLMGVLYGLAGALILYNPMIGAISLTLTLGMLYIFQGVLRIAIAFTHRLPGWGWMLASGMISLILGSLICAYWAIVSNWLIGVFIGIDMVAIGVWLTMLGWNAKTVES